MMLQAVEERVHQALVLEEWVPVGVVEIRGKGVGG